MLTCLWEKNNSGPSCSALLASSPMRTDFYFRVREDFLRNQLGNETWWICREETDREGSREGRGEKAWEGLWRGENSGGGDLTEVQHSQGTGGRGGQGPAGPADWGGVLELRQVELNTFESFQAGEWITWIGFCLRSSSRDFPGGPMAKTPCSLGRGFRSDIWSGD